MRTSLFSARSKHFSWRVMIMLVFGTSILALGMVNIHARCRITEGGVLGMTLLLRRWTGISPSITEPILDAICYYLGYRLLGRPFLIKAVIATLLYSAFYAMFDGVGYILPDLSGYPILAALVGALFVGVGVGLVVKAGGAAGGDDALALVISHKTKWNVGKCYLLTDVTVLLLSLSYIPVVNIACSLVTVTLSSAIIGVIHEGKLRHPLRGLTGRRKP